MTSIALATAAEAWEVDEDAPLLVAALEELDVDVRPAVWTDPEVDWSDVDLVVIRSTWDYTSRHDEFLAWIERVERTTSVANPSAVVAWNTDKHYLADLATAGIRTVPTTFLDSSDGFDVPGAAARILAAVPPGSDLVVKPTISAGSKDTARYRPEQMDDAVAHAIGLLDDGRDVMVQPYLDSVDDVGETGMVLIDGQLSHAFRKGALLRGGAADVDGLFAVEQIDAATATTDEVDLATEVLDVATRRLGTGPLLYARVDVLRGADGRPMLLELELTEPSFFLHTSPSAAATVAAAALRRAARG